MAADRVETLVALADAARNGGRPELERLLQESAGLVHTFLRARLGDGLAAESATQETLIRTARGLSGLRDSQAFPAWLLRIAARCGHDSAWRAARPTVSSNGHEALDRSPGPLERVLRSERRTAVHAAIASLPQRLREPLYLHFVEELSYRQIARVLGAGLGTVARRMRRALQALRTELGALR